jgi:hypothetical protein
MSKKTTIRSARDLRTRKRGSKPANREPEVTAAAPEPGGASVKVTRGKRGDEATKRRRHRGTKRSACGAPGHAGQPCG